MSIANSEQSIQERIKGILTSNQDDLTLDARESDETLKNDSPSAVNESEEEAQDTLQSDTEKPNRRRKLTLGDREVEIEILTDDVDLDQVANGLLMDSDYRKKTMSLSEKSKTFDSKQSELDSALEEVKTQLLVEAGDFDTEEMKLLQEDDPEEYFRRRNKLEQKFERYKTFKSKRDQEIEQKRIESLNSSLEKWTQAIPDWLDDTRKADDLKKIENSLKNIGFQETDWQGFYDPKMITLARKAMLYDQIQSQDIESKKQKSSIKHVASNSTSDNEKPRSKRDEAVNRARKSGKRSDAQAAIKMILGG